MAGMPGELTEAQWEQHALEWLAEWDWGHVPGPAVAPGAETDLLERESWHDLVLVDRLRAAIERVNPRLPPEAVEEVVAKIRRRESQDALAENFRVHQLLTQGVRVTYTDTRGIERNPTVWPLDFADPYGNEFLAANQVTFKSGQHERRLDLVCYVNGLPLAVFELKKADDERAHSETAYHQLRTYGRELGTAAFAIPAVAVASDGITARVGTPFTPWEHFAPWNVDEWGSPVSIIDGTALEVLITGVFEPGRFLDLLANFISFSAEGGGAVDTKKLAKPHQYFAVNKAVDATLRAIASHGQAGVVWHTQGSGKSLSMACYAAKVLRHRRLDNPTVVVLTDRLDLDDQLFRSFSASRLLPETPVQAEGREELRAELKARATGGIVFSTLQKFGKSEPERKAGVDHPLLSDRRNVIVIADEAHRSHYDFLDGYARNLRDALPYATFIAFTGTPVAGEHNTRAVFGDYVDIYDLTRAVADGATVPVYYENRHIPVRLPEGVDPGDLDERADEAAAALSDDERRRAERAFRMVEEVVGAPERLRKLAADVVGHWERRGAEMARHIGVPGKAIVVCHSRRICAALYDEIVALRPDWEHDADDKGTVKVVYTGGASDPEPISRHVRNPGRNKAIQRRMTNPGDELELVIVAAMWLTGFDCPPLRTLYLDKQMRGAALMQALARVNRPYGDKPAGLVVDYIGVAENLTEALAAYTHSDQAERPIGADVAEAVDAVREQHDVVCNLLRGYDWRAVLTSGCSTARIDATLGVVDYLRDPVRAENLRGRGEPDLADRFAVAVRTLLRAFSLCAADHRVQAYRDDIAFFDSVRVWMAKFDAEERDAKDLPNPASVELALRQLTSDAVAAGEPVDVFAAAGIERPDLSRLDEAFIERIRNSTRPNLAIEALRRMLERQIRATHPHNVVAQRTFSDRLLEAMRRYTNQALTAAEIVTELIALANDVSADAGRARELGLSEAELAFYDAVATNESAVRELGTDVLARIARDLVTAVRADVTVDWTVREQVQARLRSKVKRLLAR